jgi:glycosyltransferase involved in cell wall biosynthesis
MGTVKLAIVVPKINLETGGGSHWTLALMCRGLCERDVHVDVYSLSPTSRRSAEALRASGATLTDLAGRPGHPDTARLTTVTADAVLVYGVLAIAGALKASRPESPVLAYLNTLGGFCTNLSAQRDGCWLTCSHADRIRHHSGRPTTRLAYAVRGFHRVRALAKGFRSLDACVFNSAPLRDAYRVFGLDPSRCSVIPPCIDVAHVSRFRAAAFGGGDRPLSLLFVGTLAEYKGMALLGDALRRLRRSWRLTVYGDGADRARVDGLAREFPGCVDFRGHVTNPELFAALHGRDFLFVHPCMWFEALGRAILEAMAMEIPVVVPDVGGPSWSVVDGVTGLHYRHRDAGDLARRMEWAADHPEAVRGMAGAGRAAVARFDYRDVAREWHDLLVRVVSEHAAHA